MKMRNVKFAVVQFGPIPPTVPDNVAKNKAKASKFVERAAREGAHVIVFPEYFLTGVLADHIDLAADEAEWLEDIKYQARTHHIDIVAGTIVERSAKNKEHLLNRSYYVDKEGQVLRAYGKRNLWHPEKAYLTASKRPNQVFETSYGKVGLLVCWDLAWPESFRSLMEQGVEVVISPTFWVASDSGEIGAKHNPNSEQTYLDSLCATRAWDNGICLVFANVGDSSDDIEAAAEHGHPATSLEPPRATSDGKPSSRPRSPFSPNPHSAPDQDREDEQDPEGTNLSQDAIGRSGVFLPFYGALYQLRHGREDMFVVDVDLNVLGDAESVYKIREDYVLYEARDQREKQERQKTI